MDAALTIAWNLGLPTLFALWLALAKDGRPALIAADVLTASVWCLAMVLSALWLALPVWLILLPLLGIAPAVWVRFARRDRAHRGGPASLVLRTVALAVGLWLAGAALLGRLPLPGEPVDLASPLPSGSWLVANGGSTRIVNPHLRTLEGEASRDWRGQSYAVDLVAASGWGSRVGFTLNPELDDYEIYGVPVLAPCDGRVVITHDGDPERRHASDPWQSRPGNHVVIQCGPAWILLAHLVPGSVRVKPGVEVRVGDPLGRVGNTGASGEPHLHVHAQSPGSDTTPFGGRPYPVTIDGRSLVRNDRLHPTPAPPGP